MKLWLLRPISKNQSAWDPWYDKVFGFVIRAETSEIARRLANENGGDEVRDALNPWLDEKQATCVELTSTNQDQEIVMHDLHSA